MTDCELSSRAIQRLFNHLRLTDLAFEHEYSVGWVAWGSPSAGIREAFGEDTLSVRLLFIEPSGIVAFDVHCFLSPAGEILATGKLDPKFLVLEGKVRLELKGHRARDAMFRPNP